MSFNIAIDGPAGAGKSTAAKLAAKLMMTSTRIIRSFLAGGMITARNMPKRATLRALTRRTGIRLPTSMPSAVPIAHSGAATAPAP